MPTSPICNVDSDKSMKGLFPGGARWCNLRVDLRLRERVLPNLDYGSTIEIFQTAKTLFIHGNKHTRRGAPAGWFAEDHVL